MEALKQKIKNFFTDKELYIFTIITLLFFGVYCFIQYAPDTYGVLCNPLKQSVMHFISCGRVVTGIFIYALMGVLRLNDISVYVISFTMAIIFTILSLYKLYQIFKDDIKSKIISLIGVILIIINVFSIELFVYLEKGILMLSVFLCVLAVGQLKKFFDGNKKSIILSFIYMLIANFCYQGTVGIFVALSVLYILKYSKNIKEFIKNNIIVALLYGIPALINFLSVRFIFTNARVKGEIILIESFKKIFEGTKSMLIGTYGLLPKYLFIISVSLLLVYIILKLIKNNEKEAKIALEILKVLYIIIITIFVTIAPQILQDTNSIWFVARSSYSAGALIGILLIYAISKFEIKIPEKKIILICSCLFLLIQFVYFMNYTIDNYKVNYQDRQNVIQIKGKIEDYEKKTGKIITKVAYYEDKMPGYTYPQISATGDMNLKALYKNWSETSIIYYYTGKHLEEVEKDKNIESNFKAYNWDYYNDEQIIFVDDTMHLCNF